MRAGRIALVAVLVTALGALVFAAGALAAKPGGNKAAPCLKDGWKTLVRADGTSFSSERECRQYANKGGALLPKSAQALCQDDGGTFITTEPGSPHWTASSMAGWRSQAATDGNTVDFVWACDDMGGQSEAVKAAIWYRCEPDAMSYAGDGFVKHRVASRVSSDWSVVCAVEITS